MTTLTIDQQYIRRIRHSLFACSLAFGGALLTACAAASGEPDDLDLEYTAAELSAPAADDSIGSVPYAFQTQETDYFCGPASTRIALSSRLAGDDLPSQWDLKVELNTTEDGTDDIADVVRVLNNQLGRPAFVARYIRTELPTPQDEQLFRSAVVRTINGGYGMVVNILGTKKDWMGVSRSYDGGHYIAVVGYTDGGKAVKIADPANDERGGTYMMNYQQLAKWITPKGYALLQ